MERRAGSRNGNKPPRGCDCVTVIVERETLCTAVARPVAILLAAPCLPPSSSPAPSAPPSTRPMLYSKQGIRSLLDFSSSAHSKKVDSAPTTRSHTPESSPSSEAHRRAPLAPIDQQAFAEHMPPPSSSPSTASFSQDVSTSTSRFIGKPIMARRSSASTEEAFHSSGSSQGSAHRRRSHPHCSRQYLSALSGSSLHCFPTPHRSAHLLWFVLVPPAS
ncbi:hypothetical protein BV25DRAFT_1190077 [Artomyces pyxidatus]|uniref:Uncharacterized protein n=1 Tax=Artomyces pyxidatus TaxID=48021 RepID=A0ACB8SQI6_9AGAM|nr:hypothetical protein BV25DRAFT_1190077 [Artomyces pyxidatus]